MTFTVTHCTNHISTETAKKNLRKDLDFETQRRNLQAHKESTRAEWDQGKTQEQAVQLTPTFLQQALKRAVAESILYHYRNRSTALKEMLQGANPKLAVQGKEKKGPNHGVLRVYFEVILEDIDGIMASYGCEHAQKSVRVLPLWRCGPKALKPKSPKISPTRVKTISPRRYN